MAKSLAELNVIIAAKVKGFDKSFKKIEGGMRRLSRNAVAFGDSITQNIALPFGAALAAGVKLASGLETNFAKIENLVGVTGSQLTEFKDGVKALSTEVGQSQQDLSRALFTVTSAGQRGSNALKILEASAKASAVGLGDTQEIARATTSVIQAYGAENISAARATEILFKTVRQGNLEASQLAPALGRVIGVASAMGVSFEEVGANVATFTRLGVSSEEAITGLRSVLTTFLNPSTQAREALAQFGISAEGVRKSIADNGLSATLVGLNEKLDGNFDALGSVIPNVRALGNILGVAGSQSKEYLSITEDLKSNTDELGKAFDNVTQTSAHKFNTAIVDLKNAAIELGAVVLPVAAKMAAGVSKMAKAFSSLSAGTKETIVQVGLWVSGIGIAASVGGRMIGNMGIMVKTFRLLAVSLGKSKIAMAALNFVMSTNPVALVVKAVAIAIGAFTLWYKKSQTLRATLAGLANVAREVFTIIKETVGGFINSFKSFADGEFKAGLKQFGQALKNSNPIGLAINNGERLGKAFAEGYVNKIQEEVNEKIQAVKIESGPPVPPPTQQATDGSGGGGLTGASLGGGGGAARPELSQSLAGSFGVGLQKMAEFQTGFNVFNKSLLERYAETVEGIGEKSKKLVDGLQQDMIAIKAANANLVAASLGGFGAIIQGIQGIAGKSKGFALIEIAINSAIGVARAIAAGAGQTWPANIAAIGSGVGAVLSGIGQAKALLSKTPALAQGGLAYGPTLAMVGDNIGAANNPEVIAPLDKLSNIMGGRDVNISVDGELVASPRGIAAMLEFYQSERSRLS